MKPQTGQTLSARLLRRISDRSATIAVVGLGYVGLPLVRAALEARFRVVGFDVDEAKIRKLRRGVAYLKHLGRGLPRMLARSDRFSATSSPRELAAERPDAVILCVPTPLGPHREPDLSFVRGSTELAARAVRKGGLVVLESTSYPGTTREVCGPILRRAGFTIGRDCFLAFSPEREDPGRRSFETRTIPRLVGGVDGASARVAHALYSAMVDRVHLVESAEVAEAAKLLENVYRAVNIALVNELKPIFGAMGIDIWRVIRAAATKPFGFQPFYPGPGLGGHCIPIDPYYLSWKAREAGRPTRFIELAGEINHQMPAYVVERLAEALNDAGRPLKGSRVLVVGIAYKPNVDDVRETPAAEIISLLVARGARVAFHDPHVPKFPAMRRYRFNMRSQRLTAPGLRKADAVLIVTNHDAVDYSLIARHARLVVDTRDALASVGSVRARVVKA